MYNFSVFKSFSISGKFEKTQSDTSKTNPIFFLFKNLVESQEINNLLVFFLDFLNRHKIRLMTELIQLTRSTKGDLTSNELAIEVLSILRCIISDRKT